AGTGPRMQTRRYTVRPGAGVTVTTIPGSPRMMPFKVNSAAAGVSIVADLASIALAIYLFVIGILVLRDSRLGAKLHWWYVGLKIPAGIVAAVAGWVVWSSCACS